MRIYPKLLRGVDARSRRYGAFALAFACTLTPLSLQGQDDEEEDVFVLSPFTVDASSDSGYAATETLAGTRLKGAIRDTPATLSILTEDFMDDIGATDVESMASFLPSTEVFVLEGGDDSGNASKPGDVLSIRGFKTTTRLRNFFQTEMFGDRYATKRITFTRGPNALLFGIGNPGGSVQIGTNRAYFGNNKGSLEYKYGSLGSHRLSFDQNIELIEDRVAIRVDALRDRQDGFRKPTFDDRDALYLTTTINPFDNDGATSIRLNYETNSIDRVAARPWAIYDVFSSWVDAGAPLYDNQNDGRPGNNPTASSPFRRLENIFVDIKGQDAIDPFRATRANGSYNSYVRSAGQIANGRHLDSASITEDFVALNPLDVLADHFAANPSTDFPDLESWLAGLGDLRSIPEAWLGGETVTVDRGTWFSGTFDDYQREVDGISFFIEQRFGENLFVEIAGNMEEWSSKNLTMMRSSDIGLQYDPNLYLPDGSQNPYAGIAYVGQNQFGTDEIETGESEEYRATVSYELDFTDGESKWLNFGKHSFSGLYSMRSYKRENIQDRTHMVLWDGASTVDFNNTTRRVGVRWNGLQAKGRYYLLPGTDPYISEPWLPLGGDPSVMQANWIHFNASKNDNDQDSMAFGGQSYFFDNRLVLTYGWRKDELERMKTVQIYVPADAADPANDIYQGEVDLAATFGGISSLPTREWQNRSKGAVFHILRNNGVFDNLSVFYNEATNVSGEDIRYNIRYEEIDPVNGLGEDLGIKFGLFEGALTGSFTWFDTTKKDDYVNNSFITGRGQFSNIHNEVVKIMDPNNEVVARRDLFGGGWVPVFDSVSDGIEFQFVWNATKNLRIRGTYSDQETVLSGFAADIEEYYNEVSTAATQWLTAYDANPDPNVEVEDVDQMRTRLALMAAELPIKTTLNGVPVTGVGKSKASLTASYKMPNDSALKGFTFGGSLKYRGASPLAFELVDGAPNLANEFTAPAVSDYSFFVKYQTKIGDGKYRWTLQANVLNAFNNTDDTLLRGEWDGTTESFVVTRNQMVAPRSATISSIISW